MALGDTWSQNRDDIIKRALRLCGVLGIGETPETEAVTNAAQALNALMKQWSAHHSAPWRTVSIIETLVINRKFHLITDAGASANDGIIAILDAFVALEVDRSDLTPVEIVTQREFYPLGGYNEEKGRPEKMFPGYESADTFIDKLYLYPIPDKAYIIHYLALKAMKDFNASGDTMEMSPVWANALTFGLAADLSHEYSCPMNERQALRQEAQQKLRDAKAGTAQTPTALVRRGYY